MTNEKYNFKDTILNNSEDGNNYQEELDGENYSNPSGRWSKLLGKKEENKIHWFFALIITIPITLLVIFLGIIGLLLGVCGIAMDVNIVEFFLFVFKTGLHVENGFKFKLMTVPVIISIAIMVLFLCKLIIKVWENH